MASYDVTPTAVHADLVARCLQIARECLDGNPFRNVPALELETDRIAMEIQGRELSASLLMEAHGMCLPAHSVAENALQIVDELSTR